MFTASTFHPIKVNARSLTVRALVPVADRVTCPTCGNASGRFVYGWQHEDRIEFSPIGFCSRHCHLLRSSGFPVRTIAL